MDCYKLFLTPHSGKLLKGGLCLNTAVVMLSNPIKPSSSSNPCRVSKYSRSKIC